MYSVDNYLSKMIEKIEVVNLYYIDLAIKKAIIDEVSRN